VADRALPVGRLIVAPDMSTDQLTPVLPWGESFLHGVPIFAQSASQRTRTGCAASGTPDRTAGAPARVGAADGSAS
jgi:hypothetical protein